jgi:serine/threonine-protein kinase HipA
MARTGKVYFGAQQAGKIWQDDEGYHFQYLPEYLSSPNTQAISFTLPIRKEPYNNFVLHPFFDGLIPEGWLLDITVDNWKANPNDRMGLLLVACRDCIGAISVYPESDTL